MNMTINQTGLMNPVTKEDIVEAEQNVLAAILAENTLISDCGLEPGDFREGLHQKIYDKARELVQGHERANSASIKPFLQKDVGLGISSADYLAKLQSRGASLDIRSKFEAALQTVKGAALARDLGREASYIEALSSEGHNPLTLADEIMKLIDRLKEINRFSTTALTPPGSAYLAAFSASAQRDDVLGVPIVFHEIARVLSEPVLEAGNLYGLLSSSGEGKSSLTMQIIYHAVAHGHPVQFLSYDQSPIQCVRQMIAQQLVISAAQQREPHRLMSQKEQDQCVKFALWLDTQPLVIRRCQREGASELVSHARQFLKRYANGKTPLFVIDHIGKVKPRDTKASADKQSGEITVELKSFADEAAACVLVLNQRNTFGTRRDNPRPIASDLYGGEGARADYDAIMYLYRPEKYRAERIAIAAGEPDWKKINTVFGASDIEGRAEVGVIKSRFGDPTIREFLKFEAKYTRYESMQPKREELF